MSIGPAQGTANRPQNRTTQDARYVAPVRGVDVRIALAKGDPDHCIYSYNMVPAEYGLKVRKGYREYQIGVSEGSSSGVRTLIPFDAVEQDGLSNKLFSVTNEGIFDTTAASAAPVQKLAFADQGVNAGYGIYVHFTGQNEEDVIFYADSVNGLFSYNPQTDVWSQASGITGPDISNVRYIAVHKNRIWLIEENTNYAWYLDLYAIAGAATQFFFGSKFENGGNLAGLFNWSIDGGAGVDDYFVAVSRAGDVLVYQGSNPDDVDDWSLTGSYYIGEVPPGAAFGTLHGGDLFLLSIYGLNSMGSILEGVNSADLFNAPDTNSPSAKISEILKTTLTRTISLNGWEIRRAPSESGLLVKPPIQTNIVPTQFFYRSTNAAWAFWRDVPMATFDTWDGAVVFGTKDNRVCLMDVTADNVLITPPAEGLNGDNIVFSVLTSYQALGASTRFKNVSLIRPDILSKALPNIAVQARYDYDVAEAITTPELAPPGTSGIWDVSNWDAAVWGGGAGAAFSPLQGSWGWGRYVAIATRGDTREETFIIGWDVLYKVGGPLL